MFEVIHPKNQESAQSDFGCERFDNFFKGRWKRQIQEQQFRKQVWCEYDMNQ